MADRAIIPCWPCSVRRTSSSTAGCAAATAEAAAESSNFSKKLWRSGESARKIRLLRADSGFFDDQLLSFLEQRRLPYIVVARLTKWVRHAAQRVKDWTVIDEHYAVGEFHLKLHGWNVERRFVVVREKEREPRSSAGRRLIEVPGYTFRIFATSSIAAPLEIWRDYNGRADMENRIAELKHDLGADGFCLKQFFATEAAFRSVLLLFNLLAEFQRAAGMPGYRAPATIRTQILTCGAILGRAGAPPGHPHVGKLGRTQLTHPFARQYPGLWISNFAEVGSHRHLTAPCRVDWERSPKLWIILNFGIQAECSRLRSRQYDGEIVSIGAEHRSTP